MEKMELFKTGQGWMVKTDDPETIKAFGTDTIPTAFTARAKSGVVMREIEGLNPDALVVFRDWPRQDEAVTA